MSTTTWSPTDLDDLARDDRADLELLALSEVSLEPAITIVDDDGIELLVGNVELTKQIAIYHRVPGMFQPLWGITCPRRKPARIVAGFGPVAPVANGD